MSRGMPPRYSGNWENVVPSCPLCQMDEKTEWYLETKEWVIAEKLSGGPFVVSKTHETDLSDDDWEEMERIVGLIFDEFEIRVQMNIVEDHWHGHIITDDIMDLTDE